MERTPAGKAGTRRSRGGGKRPSGPGLSDLGKNLQVRAKAWITAGEETFLAFGRVQLLEKIRDRGSISAAARALGMSYRRAWWHVETMNRLASSPLVQTEVGGKGGGGTHLTPAGEAAVALYRRLDEKAQAFQERTRKQLQALA